MEEMNERYEQERRRNLKLEAKVNKVQGAIEKEINRVK